MGEDGTFGAWDQIQLQLDVVETCARDLDPRVCPRVVALRQHVTARCGVQPHHEPARGDESASLSEIVQEVQEMVRHLREILAMEGATLTALADDVTRGPDAPEASVAGRRRMLVEYSERLFRVSNSMWDVVRSVE